MFNPEVNAMSDASWLLKSFKTSRSITQGHASARRLRLTETIAFCCNNLMRLSH
jgi:hypothetical protein